MGELTIKRWELGFFLASNPFNPWGPSIKPCRVSGGHQLHFEMVHLLDLVFNGF